MIVDTPLRRASVNDARLSERQRQILEFMKLRAQNGSNPSIREIAEGVGLSSSSTVHKHLKNLSDKGYLETGGGKYRSVRLVNRVDWREVRGLLQRWIDLLEVYCECPINDIRNSLKEETSALLARLQ